MLRITVAVISMRRELLRVNVRKSFYSMNMKQERSVKQRLMMCWSILSRLG